MRSAEIGPERWPTESLRRSALNTCSGEELQQWIV